MKQRKGRGKGSKQQTMKLTSKPKKSHKDNLKDRVAVSLKLKYLLHKKATGKTADITQDANL